MSHMPELVVTVSSKVLSSEITSEVERVRSTMDNALTAITGGRGDVPKVEMKVDTYSKWSVEMGNHYESRILAIAVMQV